jgi:hypothetical protein
MSDRGGPGGHMKNFHITSMKYLKKSTGKEEWDLCVDGTWYADIYNGDSSDIAVLQSELDRGAYRLEEIPLRNSCENTELLGCRYMLCDDKNRALYLVR